MVPGRLKCAAPSSGFSDRSLGNRREYPSEPVLGYQSHQAGQSLQAGQSHQAGQTGLVDQVGQVSLEARRLRRAVALARGSGRIRYAVRDG